MKVGKGVGQRVLVGEGVSVKVGVFVGVAVIVGVDVTVGVTVGVDVAVDVIGTVDEGVIVGDNVFVADTAVPVTRVATAVAVKVGSDWLSERGETVAVGTGVSMGKEVSVATSKGGMVAVGTTGRAAAV